MIQKNFYLMKYKTNSAWKLPGEYRYVLVNSKNRYQRFHESLNELVKKFKELKLGYFQFPWMPEEDFDLEDNLKDNCELLLAFNELEEFFEYLENNPELML